MVKKINNLYAYHNDKKKVAVFGVITAMVCILLSALMIYSFNVFTDSIYATLDTEKTLYTMNNWYVLGIILFVNLTGFYLLLEYDEKVRKGTTDDNDDIEHMFDN